MRLFVSVVIVSCWIMAGSGCKPAGTPSSSGDSRGSQSGVSEDIAFSIPSLTSDGQLNSADYAGKVMLLDFWATWCGPCRSELPDLNALYQEMAGQGLVIIGMTLDDGPKEKLAAKVDALGLTYPVGQALDYVEQTPAFKGIRAIPTKYLVKDGVIVGGPYKGVIPVAQIKADIIKHL